ncbi:hypothetical protein PsYK624_151280 [Phanerochaete sordida]|uniref:Fungal calcium binding protein domain-containing protein n=1 Tax=Phanerochaete sordida TaxID=48140 RepID=A0A9P3LKU7_9APHY|nr:hypothetical protein PsYK624_151280 [Phanerochaete sordida]
MLFRISLLLVLAVTAFAAPTTLHAARAPSKPCDAISAICMDSIRQCVTSPAAADRQSQDLVLEASQCIQEILDMSPGTCPTTSFGSIFACLSLSNLA